ncbi:hypothetical protein FQZ97_822220 [compost metagenome]
MIFLRLIIHIMVPQEVIPGQAHLLYSLDIGLMKTEVVPHEITKAQSEGHIFNAFYVIHHPAGKPFDVF